VSVTALSTQLQVTDRPVTQQGLGGPKTAGVRGTILFLLLPLPTRRRLCDHSACHCHSFCYSV